MRLWRNCDLTLCVEDRSLPQAVHRTVRFNITDLLAKVKDDHGEFLYDTDAKLSFYDEYDIAVTLDADFILMELTINKSPCDLYSCYSSRTKLPDLNADIMKPMYIYAMLLAGAFSCTRSGPDIIVPQGEQEVHLTILTFNQPTRAPQPDVGVERKDASINWIY